MILPLKYLLQNTIQHILIANEQALCFTWHAHNSQNLAFLFLHSQDYASKNKMPSTSTTISSNQDSAR